MTPLKTKTDELIAALDRKVARARASIEEWAKVFAAEPYRALEHANDAYEQVARVRVWGYVLAALTGENTKADFDTVHSWATTELVRRAGDPPRSTSPSHNMLEVAATKQWAELLELMRWM